MDNLTLKTGSLLLSQEIQNYYLESRRQNPIQVTEEKKNLP